MSGVLNSLGTKTLRIHSSVHRKNLGEVSRIVLKEKQSIRQDEEFAEEDLEVEVADVVIYLLDFCARNDVSLSEGLHEARTKVLDRDFDGGSD